MHKFYIGPTDNTPEIHLSPDENIFFIRGISSPEDVRSLYYPVNEWFKIYIDKIIEEKGTIFSPDNPLKLQIDLEYFNSSSAKFLFDIIMEIKRASLAEIPVIIEWYYDSADHDLRSAGSDIALLAEMEFTYIQKK